MTSIERTAAVSMGAAALGSSTHRHAVSDAAIRHAVLRDVDRLTQVLGEPVNDVRRTALAGHIGFLLDQLQAHHRLQDEVIWPRVGVARADLADVADRVRVAHAELVEPSRTLRRVAQRWTYAPASRPDVLDAVMEFDARLDPVLGQDAELVPLARSALSPREWTEIDRHLPAKGGPTRRARRMFWMLDQLDQEAADVLLQRTPRAEMWILRNGFSGAYNRSAYLMWVGGGTGPAV
ncbi:hemerythrin domain-containing protein [Nakamurella sp. GG22]